MMMWRLLVLLTGTLLGVVGGKQDKIPPYLKICSRNDPNLNECVKQSVDGLREQLRKGIPELGIPSCEPLELTELVLNQGKGAVTVTSTYRNIKIYGPTKFELRSVKVDLERKRVRIKLWLPYLHMTSDYTMNGRILMMPIVGSGLSEGNYTDIEATCLMQGEHLHKHGKTYYNVKDFGINFKIGHAKVHLDDLFNGDKELGNAMNMFINENWQNVASEIKPILEEKIGDMFKEFSNKIYHKFPLDQLLPP